MYVMPQGSGAMVILPVDVVGDRTTHSYILGAWRDWKEPTLWQDNPDYVAEQQACLTLKDAIFGAEADEVVKASGIDQCASVVEACVAVAAAIPEAQAG